MEEYLQNLRHLRSQMNDIEEAAAKRSVEEQKQKTSIEALEKDLHSVESETTHLNIESKEMENERALICQQISEKQKKLLSLDDEAHTLLQSIELLRQEIIHVSAKLEERSCYFSKIMEESVFKLQQKLDWLNSFTLQMASGNQGKKNASRKAKYEELKTRKNELNEEKHKSELLRMQLEQKSEAFTPAIKELDLEALQEEHKALLADVSGEIDYLNSLMEQIKQLKSVSHEVKCQCGEQYKVELMDYEIVL
ncbi:hypothetical protein HPP92_003433 [Vanilla planifolia]|uniref:Uncharacterized protein n=1 Tax=Vanilla planifolia TaxID=51239 RepID=A0A835S3L8_VANPL|nr:hypothetical protein HPP92_003433 [Vanilla planifolia]